MMRHGLRSLLVAMIVAGVAIWAPIAPAPQADALLITNACGDPNATHVATKYFYRDGVKLSYASLKILRSSTDPGEYCIAFGSEYVRPLSNSGMVSNLQPSGSWLGNAGWVMTYRGTVSSYTTVLDLSSGTRVAETFRVTTASGNYYYAKTGWLYGG
jgi:hypothetical protein